MSEGTKKCQRIYYLNKSLNWKKKINIVCRRQKDTQANTSSEEANYQTYQSEGLE